MLWFLLALITAIFASTNDLLRKIASRKIKIFTISFFSVLILALLITSYNFVYGFSFPQSHIFYLAVAINGFIHAFTEFLYVYALKHGDISISVPMLSFTPLFMILTSFIILGEFPNIYGIIGIMLIVFGAFVLTTKTFVFEYFFRERSTKIMLVIAFIWSISASLDKFCVLLVPPEVYIMFVSLLASLFLFPLFLIENKNHIGNFYSKHFGVVICIGIVKFLLLLAQMYALLLTKAAYVIATKRLSIVFSTFFGGKFFKEKELRKRIIAAIIMFFGMSLILVLG